MNRVQAGLAVLLRAAGICALVSLASCATFPLSREHAARDVAVLPGEELRATQASRELRELKASDVHVRMANEPLADIMRHALQEMSGRDGALTIRNIQVSFGHQAVSLSARHDWRSESGLETAIQLSGEVHLAFSGNHLLWIPNFGQADTLIRDAADRSAPEQDALLEIVRRANATIVEPMVIEGLNGIPLDYFPSMRMEAGAAIGDSAEARFVGRQDLAGFFGLAGQALLIEPEYTSAILDLEPLPNISQCESELTLSRSTFARDIRQREPAVVALQAGVEESELHFFTEVQGASRSTSIVHYWFADGQPVGLEELVVEPSARWRTWSTQPAERIGARVWEVVVVERDTGCVLQSRTISVQRTGEPEPTTAGSGTFEAYVAAFEKRLDGLDGLAMRPEPIVVETREAFLSEAAGTLLSKVAIELSVEFAGPERSISAVLHPFRVDGQVCRSRDCRSDRVCQAAVSRCVRQRDTRDCNVCSFRNPLNNRCMSEVEDPVCVTSRAARNRQHEREREACLAEEERARVDCERLRAQEIRSCEIESSSAETVCSTNFKALELMRPQVPMALIEGRVSLSGSAIGRFVDFEMAPDFSALKMAFEFAPGATYTGHWAMRPTKQGEALAACLSSQQGDFESRLLMPAPRLALIGSPVREHHEWVTNWSGFVLAARVSPTPLESVIRERPDFPAACGIALTVESFKEAIRGRDAGFLGGRAELEIRPLPSRLAFGSDVIRFGGREYVSAIALQAGRLQVKADRVIPKG